MTNYKLKTISNTEMLCFTEDSMDYTNWYTCVLTQVSLTYG